MPNKDKLLFPFLLIILAISHKEKASTQYNYNMVSSSVALPPQNVVSSPAICQVSQTVVTSSTITHQPSNAVSKPTNMKKKLRKTPVVPADSTRQNTISRTQSMNEKVMWMQGFMLQYSNACICTAYSCSSVQTSIV